MGQVAVTLKLMPESPDTDLVALENEIREKIAVQEYKVVPVGFGISMIELMILFDDSKGGSTDHIEEQLRRIPGVASVETADVTLV